MLITISASRVKGPCLFDICLYRGFPQNSVGRIHLQCRRPRFDSWVRKISWRRKRLLTPVFLGFPCGSAGKEPTCNAGDLGSIPGLGKSPGKGKGYPVQYSGLENSMDYTVHGVTKSRTQLSDFHFHFVLQLFAFLPSNFWMFQTHLCAT